MSPGFFFVIFKQVKSGGDRFVFSVRTAPQISTMGKEEASSDLIRRRESPHYDSKHKLKGDIK
jgi:hypothetical protein